ncbi:glycosyltransferase family 4 protein [Zoogloeaceae bacterium G21618-S1]|nr:glycosyltransferase family 4 protein [Zoogloeaceae bacterium G21618-S1]
MSGFPGKRVLVVQRRLTHYRLPFFEALKTCLADRGCQLVLAHGEPSDTERAKSDTGDLNWAERLETRYWFGDRVCWQPFGALMRQADMTVVTAENKLLYNLVAQSSLNAGRVALWGHGANLQGDPGSLRERFKRFTAQRADWWFGYTDLSVPLIERSGFPAERISVLNNTIDTAEMVAMRARVDDERVAQVRRALGLTTENVGIYVGSLYAEKRIDFMLDAAAEVRRRVPDFEFLIVGGGAQADRVIRFCAENPWARYLGVLKGQDKIDVLAISKVMVNPGAVGLGILDAFVCHVPMVTTACGMHGPEIAYIESGHNGAITENAVADYVAVVCAVLSDNAFYARLVAGCVESAARYSLKNMTTRFADGVEQCLAVPRYRSAPR